MSNIDSHWISFPRSRVGMHTPTTHRHSDNKNPVPTINARMASHAEHGNQNNEAIMRQKIDYIHHNPVKRGYVDQAEHWRHSSARDYAGEQGLLEVLRQW